MGFGRDRTERTDNRTEGISFGGIARANGFGTFEDLDLAVKGDCRAVGEGCAGTGILGGARFGGEGNGLTSTV
jgi:hypothetical protein